MPSKSTAAPKRTSKSVTPTRRSSNSMIPPKEIVCGAVGQRRGAGRRRDRGAVGVGRGLAGPVAQLGAAEPEAVGPDDQAGPQDVLRVQVGRDHAGDAEARELDQRLVDADDLLRALGRLVVVRVVADLDPGGRELHDVRDLDEQRGDGDVPLAGDAERVGQRGRVADRAGDRGDVDGDVEGAEQAGQRRGDPALALRRRAAARGRRAAATEGQRRRVGADADRQDQLAALEGRADEADREAVERQRAERGRGRAAGVDQRRVDGDVAERAARRGSSGRR